MPAMKELSLGVSNVGVYLFLGLSRRFYTKRKNLTPSNVLTPLHITLNSSCGYFLNRALKSVMFEDCRKAF
jgi:hypothetical protein